MNRDDATARVLACQIFTQLPADEGEALKVLAYVKQIIMNLGSDWDQEAQDRVGVASVANVITLFADEQAVAVG